jgi:4a-hydroxytetrahydrobiopterin dehydratase
MVAESGETCELAARECVPCRGGVPPLEGEELDQMAEQLDNDWSVVEGHHLEKDFEFEDFRQALDFVNKIGELAEDIGHHPDIYLTYGEVGVTIWTHKIDGLAEADFIFAAKVDSLLEE